MANQENFVSRENIGRGLELGGIIGAIIGLATLQPEVVIFSGAVWYGGKKMKGNT